MRSSMEPAAGWVVGVGHLWRPEFGDIKLVLVLVCYFGHSFCNIMLIRHGLIQRDIPSAGQISCCAQSVAKLARGDIEWRVATQCLSSAKAGRLSPRDGRPFKVASIVVRSLAGRIGSRLDLFQTVPLPPVACPWSLNCPVASMVSLYLWMLVDLNNEELFLVRCW